METVKILRALWKLRAAVLCVLALSLYVGVAVAFKVSYPPKIETRQYDAGIATVRILVDTPKSQVIEVAPQGSDAVGVRASLLATLLVEDVIKDSIARRAHLEPNKLVGFAESAAAPTASPPKPAPGRQALITRVVEGQNGEHLPIIEIETQAGSASRAAALASATVGGLQDYLASTAASERIPNARRLRVSALGTAQAEAIKRGPGPLMGVSAAILIFLAGCAALLAVTFLIGSWIAAAKEDELAAAAHLVEVEPEPEDDDEGEDDEVLNLFAPVPGPQHSAERRDQSAAER
jgi:hypothetical protein